MFLFWKSFQLLIGSHLSAHFLRKEELSALQISVSSAGGEGEDDNWGEWGGVGKNKSVLPLFMIYS